MFFKKAEGQNLNDITEFRKFSLKKNTFLYVYIILLEVLCLYYFLKKFFALLLCYQFRFNSLPF